MIFGMIAAVVLSFVLVKMIDYLGYEQKKKKEAEEKGKDANNGCVLFWVIAIIVVVIIAFGLDGC